LAGQKVGTFKKILPVKRKPKLPVLNPWNLTIIPFRLGLFGLLNPVQFS